MPQGEALSTVKAPVKTVWDFLSDMKNVATCIPRCEVDVIDADKSLWRLTAKVGFASKTVELKTRVTERIAAKHAAWIGEGENIGMTGSLDLRPISDKETEVHFRLSIEATGSMGAIINNVIAGKMDEYKNGFMSCVKSKLEAPSSS